MHQQIVVEDETSKWINNAFLISHLFGFAERDNEVEIVTLIKCMTYTFPLSVYTWYYNMKCKYQMAANRCGILVINISTVSLTDISQRAKYNGL